MQVFHDLTDADNGKTVYYCQLFKNFIRGDFGILDKVFFKGEAGFPLTGMSLPTMIIL